MNDWTGAFSTALPDIPVFCIRIVLMIILCESIEVLCMIILDGHRPFELYMLNFVVGAAPADGLAIDSARASAGTVLIYVGACISLMKIVTFAIVLYFAVHSIHNKPWNQSTSICFL